MILGVSVLLFGGLLVYAGLHGEKVSDVLMGRPGNPVGTSLLPAGPVIGGSVAGPSGNGSRQAIVAAAQSALSIKSGYSQHRPYPKSLAACATQPTDCSGFVTLCYKEAGCKDPNHAGYSGAGFTGTLELFGRFVGQPQPGDLAFWHSPDHVAVVTGGTDIIGWGSPPGPQRGTVAGETPFHASFAGYRRYL